MQTQWPASDVYAPQGRIIGSVGGQQCASNAKSQFLDFGQNFDSVGDIFARFLMKFFDSCQNPAKNP